MAMPLVSACVCVIPHVHAVIARVNMIACAIACVRALAHVHAVISHIHAVA